MSTNPTADPSSPNAGGPRRRHNSLKRRALAVSPLAAALTLAACGGTAVQAASGTPASAKAQPTAVAAAAPSAPRASAARRSHARRSRGTVVRVRTSQYGRILTDTADRSIYAFTADRTSTSTCYGACATAWPPVITHGNPVAGHGLGAKLGVTRRRDGSRQVTYAGHPLYYYTGDFTQPGKIFCQNVFEYGGTWLVVSSAGAPVR